MVGSVLTPYRRVRRGASGWEIELTPTPARITRTRSMRWDTCQRSRCLRSPYSISRGSSRRPRRARRWSARRSQGTTRTATIFNVIGMLGERSGPVDSEWHRATVIVSQDRLLSPREMDYWTFAVKRLEESDRRRCGRLRRRRVPRSGQRQSPRSSNRHSTAVGSGVVARDSS